MDNGARYTLREAVLDRAKGYITQERNKSYGEPDEDFQRIAGILNAMGFRAEGGAQLEGHHVSLIMVGLKLSRLCWSPGHQDSWDDIAGYAACGYETAMIEGQRREAATEAGFAKDLTDLRQGH